MEGKSKKKSHNASSLEDIPKQEDAEQRSGIWQDERFQHLVTDPRFKNLHKSQRKVKIDKRFQSMFTDKKFNVKYTVDKYGRRVNQSTAENLKKYYELDSSASEDEKEGNDDEEIEGKDDEAKEAAEQKKEEKAITRDSDDSGESTKSETDAGENDELVVSADELDEEEVRKSLSERMLDPDIDYARGQGRLVTDSSSGEESTDEDEPGLQIDHVWGELANDAETTDESTRRLAVCNMDWDRIRATDLMVLFSSFLPPGGSVLSVKIYPSEFGKERMDAEEKYGPMELIEQERNKVDSSKKKIKKSKNDSSSDSEDDLVEQQDSEAEEGDEYHMEKLREYQLKRLRYYYAVVECDSVKTADKIYQECDGIEYESSATKVDLRFVPDDTTFDDDEPRDICTELPDSNSYKPRRFTTTALQQAKVDLTWDETSVERQELGDKLLTGKLEDVSDADLRKIVAYSSEEDENEEEGEEEVPLENNGPTLVEENNAGKKPKKKKEDAIAKYKALLAEINEQEQKERNQKYGMEVSWTIGKEKYDEGNEDQDSDVPKTQQEITPIEKALQKRSEKNKKRKEERKKKKKQLQGNSTDDSGTDDDSVPDDIDLNDPYFTEEFAKGDFIESKTKSKLKSKKQKKKHDESDETETKNEQELQLLLDDGDLEEENKQHFSLEKILKAETETKSKRKRRQQLKKSKSVIAEDRKEIQDNFEVDLNDDRFKAVYSSHLYNIDPTDSHFKKTKGMEQIISEKLKRRHGDINKNATQEETFEEELKTKRPKKQLENTLLVKSLKRKIKMQQQS